MTEMKGHSRNRVTGRFTAMMARASMKVTAIPIIMAVLLFTIILCPPQRAEAASDTMTVTAIDLGGKNTGEATMVTAGNGASLLIDSGDRHNRTIFTWLNKNGYKKKKFDTLVTHWHDDHAGNTAEIIEKYKVGKVYLPRAGYLYEKNNEYYKYERTYYRAVIKAAKKRGTKIVYLKTGQKIKVGNSVVGEVLYVNSSPRKENWYDVQRINNQSAAIMFSGGGSRFLAAGDLQKQGEKRILKSGKDLHADLFKLSHHGYSYSNTKNFLKAVSPTYTWFTSSKSTASKYKHKDVKDSVNRAEKIANTFGTRYNGTLKFTCSKGRMKVKAGRNTCTMYRELTNIKSGKKKTIKFLLNKACMPKLTEKMEDSSVYYGRQVTSKGRSFTGNWKKKGGKWYLRNSYGVFAVGTMAYKDGKYYAFNDDGTRVENGWKTFYGDKYYFGPYRYTGLRTINGKQYFFGNDGKMRTGWQIINGEKYYFDDDGTMIESADMTK